MCVSVPCYDDKGKDDSIKKGAKRKNSKRVSKTSKTLPSDNYLDDIDQDEYEEDSFNGNSQMDYSNYMDDYTSITSSVHMMEFERSLSVIEFTI